jgi:hypothetical protein
VRFNTQTVLIPTTKNAHLLGPVKDDVGL